MVVTESLGASRANEDPFGRAPPEPHRPPHVLFLVSWYPSSPEEMGGSFFREQAIALASAGFRVGVVAVHLRSPRQWKLLLSGPRGVQHENDCGVETFRFHGVNWWTRLPRWFTSRWLRHARSCVDRYIADHGKPDVVHAQSLLYGGVLAGQLRKELGIPFVVTEHNSGFARGTYKPWQLALASHAARSAEIRLAVSPALARTLRDKLGDTAEWELLPNMVHRRFFDAPLPAAAPTGDGFTFLSLSALIPNKNVHGLLEAFRKVRQQDKTVVLHVGGDGPERLRLESLARELGVADSVVFLGNINREGVPAAMGSAHAFVLPSEYETFGLVLIEAQAMGLPTIATSCGGPEWILDDSAGILVDPKDVDALATAMVEIRNRYAAYEKGRLRSECRARFGEEALVQRLSAAYNRVLRSDGQHCIH